MRSAVSGPPRASARPRNARPRRAPSVQPPSELRSAPLSAPPWAPRPAAQARALPPVPEQGSSVGPRSVPAPARARGHPSSADMMSRICNACTHAAIRSPSRGDRSRHIRHRRRRSPPLLPLRPRRLRRTYPRHPRPPRRTFRRHPPVFHRRRRQDRRGKKLGGGGTARGPASPSAPRTRAVASAARRPGARRIPLA